MIQVKIIYNGPNSRLQNLARISLSTFVNCAYVACSICIECYVKENHMYASVDRILAQRVN